MKKIACFGLSALLAVLCMSLAACGGEGERVALSASNNVYSHGEQTVQLTLSSSENGEYVFEEDISVSDLTVGDGLAGKEVTAVVYVDDRTVSVTLSGTVTATVGDEGLLGSVTVNGGISDRAIGTAYLTVYRPQMTTTGTSSSNIGNLHNYSSTFALPYGSFVEEYVDAEHITLPDTNGTLEVGLTEAGELYIRVKGFTPSEDASYPVAHIAAEVTTFHKELYVYVGLPAIGQGGGYDLVSGR